MLPGANVQAQQVQGLLAGRYDVVVADGSDAFALLRSQAVQAVIADTGTYLPLERHLVGHQSNVLLNALGEGVCLADSDGQVVWGNPRFLGYDPQTRARIGAACRQAAKVLFDGQPVESRPANSRRYEVASADESKFYEVMVSPIAAEGGARHVAAVVWDATAVRRTQRKMAAIESAGAELVKLDADLIRKMNTGERLRVLEQKIVKSAHDLMHFDHFAIRLVDERTGKLELVMSQGLPPEAMEVELFARREGNGISGFVAATGKSYICNDTGRDPRYVMGIVAARSSLTVPLRLSDKVIGIFNVESTILNAFGEEDRQFAEMFANYVALALHILDLLVVERATTGATVSGTMEGELAEPLEDIAAELVRIKQEGGAADPNFARHLERISADVDAIRRRVKDVASGPRNILGAERALSDVTVDPAMAGKRVLVVDDEPRIRQVIRDVLRARGAEVVICERGGEAIEVLTGVGAPSGGLSGPGTERTVGDAGGGVARPFDLLISDIKLPDKTGYEIFAAARRTNAGLPVILMTGFGYDPHHSIVRASQEGLSCVLFKPFQAERLIEEVHKALAGRS
ncbi:MAG: GAF domain-containing protein [Phycisphaerae bacterium]|nr:GAF domain-containing protein [Phycisphaerae bacterium]